MRSTPKAPRGAVRRIAIAQARKFRTPPWSTSARKIDRARTGAHISVVALHYNPVPVNFLNVLMKELVIRGSINYPARFSDAIELLQRRDLAEIDGALEVLADSRECGKVMIEMTPAECSARN